MWVKNNQVNSYKGKIWMLSLYFLFIPTLLSLNACTLYDFSKQYVQQGNFISSRKIERLKLGMSKEEVAVLMGTSLLSPLFNNERWDYAYTMNHRGQVVMIRHVSLYFKGDRLVRIEQRV